MISIAMTTFNGSRYIIEQLDSILHQTVLPDEVIICDDRSSDSTVQLVEDYIERNALSNWRISVNEKNLGWKQNFRRAVSMTKGDIVFFADQDDIWMPWKLEEMSAFMIKHNMGCLYGECIKIDADGKELRERNSINNFSNSLNKIDFSPSFFSVGGLGCCMCVHRRVITKYLQLDVAIDDHDSQCPRIAVLYDTLWHLDKAVIKYRIYSGNTSGISSQYSYGSSDLKHRVDDIKSICTWLSVVLNDLEEEDARKHLIRKLIKLQNSRVSYLMGEKGNCFQLIKQKRYYPDMTMLIGDIAYRHRMNKTLGKLRWNLEKIRTQHRER